jgi:dCTP deaminase
VILSNVEIARALQDKRFLIEGLDNATDPTKAPFNTSAVDLRLGTELIIPKSQDPVQLDLHKGGIAAFLHRNSERRQMQPDQPYSLKRNVFVLANTREMVDFPLSGSPDSTSYAARVEGKSSLARCGLLVHFTAPTIHAGFRGTITLEIINLGPFDILLTPGMPICQLIIEEVRGSPADAPNQFKGQVKPAGNV